MKKIVACLIGFGFSVSCAYADVVVTYGQKSVNSWGNFTGVCSAITRKIESNGNKSMTFMLVSISNSTEIVNFKFTDGDFQEGLSLNSMLGKKVSISTRQVGNDLFVTGYGISS